MGVRWCLASMVGVAAIFAWGTAAAVPPPPAAIAVLTLPGGKLQLISGSDGSITFFDTARTGRVGDVVTVVAFQVFEPGVKTKEGPAVQMVKRSRIDCRARTETETGSVAYDVAGRMVMWLPAYPTERIKPGSPGDYQAKVFCDGVQLQSLTVTGHAEARRVAHEKLAEHRTVR